MSYVGKCLSLWSAYGWDGGWSTRLGAHRWEMLRCGWRHALKNVVDWVELDEN